MCSLNNIYYMIFVKDSTKRHRKYEDEEKDSFAS